MKSKKFSVPSEDMAGFASQIEELELKNEIIGIDENDTDCTLVRVFYDPDDRDAINELMCWYEDNVAEEYSDD
jgi:hypothetical protein